MSKALSASIGFLSVMLASCCGSAGSAAGIEQTEILLAEFERYSGARLVFTHGQLPSGRYHDIMLPLSSSRQHDAAEICLKEVRKYPQGYLGAMGLKAIGVFAACGSRDGDGYREFDRRIGGYRYYGIWNGNDGIAAAYYTDGQLPLTFHHEVFHHIDGTQAGINDAARYFASDDQQFAAAVAGRHRYAALQISANDRKKLAKACKGYVLEDAVSSYSAKAHGEDQAETARHMMTTLADSLLQAAERPELAGSQRILHCLTQYTVAVKDGPTADVSWFVDLALGRISHADTARARASRGHFSREIASSETDSRETASAVALAKAEVPAPANEAFIAATPEQLLKQLQTFAQAGTTGWDGLHKREAQARKALDMVSRLDRKSLSKEQAVQIVSSAAEVTHKLLSFRLRAAGVNDVRYAIWGKEDDNGINWTLREDLANFSADAIRLDAIAEHAIGQQSLVVRSQLTNLRLVARYYSFIKLNWDVSGGTQTAFEQVRDAFAKSLPQQYAKLSWQIAQLELDELARRLPSDGSPRLLDDRRTLESVPHVGRNGNAFLINVDRKISDFKKRQAIHAVQPACVRFDTASGCCISPRGIILTAAHVPRKLGRTMRATFPNGKSYMATCTALNEYLDIAVMQIEGVDSLPHASLAVAAPEVGTWVCAIGQPGANTPTGELTGYGAFHVSTGCIRGFKRDRLGHQMLGGAKHDAWTYWGHSGCPLFNAEGNIVAMHNSWDPSTAMRHGVTHEAIVYFLQQARLDFSMAK